MVCENEESEEWTTIPDDDEWTTTPEVAAVEGIRRYPDGPWVDLLLETADGEAGGLLLPERVVLLFSESK